jgi:hypothetical protein
MIKINNIKKNSKTFSFLKFSLIFIMMSLFSSIFYEDIFATFAGGKSIYLLDDIIQSITSDDKETALDYLDLVRHEIQDLKEQLSNSNAKDINLETSKLELLLNNVIQSITSNDKDTALIYLDLFKDQLSKITLLN